MFLFQNDKVKLSIKTLRKKIDAFISDWRFECFNIYEMSWFPDWQFQPNIYNDDNKAAATSSVKENLQVRYVQNDFSLWMIYNVLTLVDWVADVFTFVLSGCHDLKSILHEKKFLFLSCTWECGFIDESKRFIDQLQCHIV